MKRLYLYFTLLVFLSSCISQKKLSKSTRVNSVIGKARTYIGTPYKWGGNDKKGIDCSGLLVRSFESVGMKLPRTTSQQIDLGKKVSLKKSKEGDLVFFAFGKSKRKVTHVGLVSNVEDNSNIKFIHASSSKGVVETQLIRDYYLKRIRKIKRVF
jgi:cell wall-associated NlpC family hydrolase|tara:strand:- start:11 stop:475 length:465 start_codon:yes stop_codon:yes gene_type:complete